MASNIDEIINFWFQGIDKNGDVAKSQQDKWFIKDPAFDQVVGQQFSALINSASQGKCDHWQTTALGRLALILIFDQFPRNIYRNQAKAFAYDHQALQLTLDGLAQQQDQALLPLQRVFFYLPLEHAENRSMQDLSVELFTKLSPLLPNHPSFLNYAKQHRDIIYQFGRYPHRNAILNRPSTAEELTFLTTHQGF